MRNKAVKDLKFVEPSQGQCGTREPSICGGRLHASRVIKDRAPNGNVNQQQTHRSQPHIDLFLKSTRRIETHRHNPAH
jgi:hypothetical protein